MFTYTATARSRAVQGLGVGLVVCALGAFFLLFWWTIILGIVGVLFAAVGLFILGLSLIQLVVGGRWDIRIEHGEVIWDAPKVSEGSFRYRLDQVAFVERQVRTKTRKDGSTKTKIRYGLIGPHDARHDLSKQSGIDVEAFVAALGEHGITVKDALVS